MMRAWHLGIGLWMTLLLGGVQRSVAAKIPLHENQGASQAVAVAPVAEAKWQQPMRWIGRLSPRTEIDSGGPGLLGAILRL